MARLEVRAASDSELLEATRAGHPEAFGELWRRHSQAAHTAARNIAPSLDPQDLTSEAFLKILRSLKAGKGPTGAFRPYLYSVLRSTSADWFAASGPSVTSTPDLLALVPDTQTMWPWDDETLDGDTALRAFASLEERWKTVLWYVEIERLPPREVATLMGTSANSVSKLVARARDGLQVAWITAHLSTKKHSPECERPLKRLPKFIAKKLSPSATANVESHLSQCGHCRSAASELSAARQRMALAVLILVVGGGSANAFLSSFNNGVVSASPNSSAPSTPTPIPAMSGRVTALIKTPAASTASLGATLVLAVSAAAFVFPQLLTPSEEPTPIRELSGNTSSELQDSKDTKPNRSSPRTQASQEEQNKNTPQVYRATSFPLEANQDEFLTAPEDEPKTPSDTRETRDETSDPTSPEEDPDTKQSDEDDKDDLGREGEDDNGGEEDNGDDDDNDDTGNEDDGYDFSLKPNYLCYFEHEGPGSHSIAGIASVGGTLKLRITQPPALEPVELIVAHGVTTGTDENNWWFTESLTPLEKWPGLSAGDIRTTHIEVQLLSSDGRSSPWSTITLPDAPPPIETCGI